VPVEHAVDKAAASFTHAFSIPDLCRLHANAASGFRGSRWRGSSLTVEEAT
jgi:hypothetical protein